MSTFTDPPPFGDTPNDDWSIYLSDPLPPCTCVPASAYFPAEPDETCPLHRPYDPEEG